MLWDSEIICKTKFSYQNHQGALYKYLHWAPPEFDKPSGEACNIVVGEFCSLYNEHETLSSLKIKIKWLTADD